MSANESLQEKAGRFAYSLEEKEAIAAELPDPAQPTSRTPTWEQKHSRWRKEIDPDEFKREQVAHPLEQIAVNFLRSTLVFQSNEPSILQDFEAINLHASKLIKLLDPTTPKTSRIGMFYMDIIMDTEPHEFSDSTLLLKLKEVLARQVPINSRLTALFADEYEQFENNALAKFVNDVLFQWEYWTGKQPGASKASNPASRFFAEVYNPVAKFADLELGGRLSSRAKFPIDGDSAANMIYRYYVFDDEANY